MRGERCGVETERGAGTGEVRCQAAEGRGDGRAIVARCGDGSRLGLHGVAEELRGTVAVNLRGTDEQKQEDELGRAQAHGCEGSTNELSLCYANAAVVVFTCTSESSCFVGLAAYIACMADTGQAISDPGLAAQVAKLWPHREHEANFALGQFCRVGLHRWRRLNLSELIPGKDVLYCFRCSKIKIDGVVHDP